MTTVLSNLTRNVALSVLLSVVIALPALANDNNNATQLASNTEVSIKADAPKTTTNDLKTDTTMTKQKVSIDVMLMLYKVIPTQEQPIF